MRVRMNVRSIALLLGIAMTVSSQSEAATRLWSSNASTDFNLAGNWNTAVAPNAADEYSMGAVNTVDSTMTANATVNGLIFTNGRNVTLDIATFQLLTDGGAANDIAVTGSGGAHLITGDKAGTADLVFSGGGNNQINVAAGSSLNIDATLSGPAASVNFRFLKDGTGSVLLSADNSSTWSLGPNPGSATFTPLTVRGGVLTLGNAGSKGANSNNVSVFQGSAAQSGSQGGGTLRISSNLVFNDHGGTNNTQGFLEISGRGWTGGDFATGEGSLRVTSGNNTISTSAGGEVRFANNGDIAESAARIRVDAGSSLTIDTPIVNGALFNPAVPNFEKVGTGLLVFADAAKTYTGNSTVMEGTLRVNANYTGGADFNVDNLATLQGTGDLVNATSDLSIDGGGTLAPGASIGTFSIGGSVDLLTDGNGNSILAIEYDGIAGLANDLIDKLIVDGDLDITGGTLSFAGLDDLDDAALVFASYGSLTGANFASVAGVPTNYQVVYGYNDGFSSNNIALVQVPEPGAIGLALIGLGSAVLIRRRRA
jgi:autotransporter-associated beta strand protein